MKKYWLSIGIMVAILALLSSSLTLAAENNNSILPTAYEDSRTAETLDTEPEPPVPEQAPAIAMLEWPQESRFEMYSLPATRARLNEMLLAQSEPTAPELASTVALQEWPQESRFEMYSLPATRARLNEMLLAQTEPTAPELDSTLALQEWPQESRFEMYSLPATRVRLNEMLLAQTEPTASQQASTVALQEWPQESRFEMYPFPETRIRANKMLYRLALQSFFETGDVETLLAYYPPELAEQRAQEWSAWQDAFSGLTVTLDFQIAEDDRVLNCWTFSGVHSSEYLDVPPSGNRVEFTGLFTSRMQGGKIIEEMVEVDRYDILQQMTL